MQRDGLPPVPAVSAPIRPFHDGLPPVPAVTDPGRPFFVGLPTFNEDAPPCFRRERPITLKTLAARALAKTLPKGGFKVLTDEGEMPRDLLLHTPRHPSLMISFEDWNMMQIERLEGPGEWYIRFANGFFDDPIHHEGPASSGFTEHFTDKDDMADRIYSALNERCEKRIVLVEDDEDDEEFPITFKIKDPLETRVCKYRRAYSKESDFKAYTRDFIEMVVDKQLDSYSTEYDYIPVPMPMPQNFKRMVM